MRHFFTFVWNASGPYFGRETNERAKYTRRERPGGHGRRGAPERSLARRVYFARSFVSRRK